VPDTKIDECEAMAESAGLRYVSDDEPGIARRRCGSGFRYVTSSGGGVGDADRQRIDELAVPPAWTDVWISADRVAHLQVTGRDDRDRKQYLYHRSWRELRDEAKFDELAQFGRRLGDVRKRVESDLAGTGLGLHRAVAAVVRLLDVTLIRVGNERYAAENDTFGATTLEPRHVIASPEGFRLEFTGKSGVDRRLLVEDPVLVEAIAESLRHDQRQVFCYLDDGGGLFDVASNHVNAYLAEIAGPVATAKTFRTWGATARAVAHLGAHPGSGMSVDRRCLAAIDVAAEALGNTRAVCRSCYVAPAITAAVESGELDRAWAASRSGRWRNRAESTTAKLLCT